MSARTYSAEERERRVGRICVLRRSVEAPHRPSPKVRERVKRTVSWYPRPRPLLLVLRVRCMVGHGAYSVLRIAHLSRIVVVASRPVVGLAPFPNRPPAPARLTHRERVLRGYLISFTRELVEGSERARESPPLPPT